MGRGSDGGDQIRRAEGKAIDLIGLYSRSASTPSPWPQPLETLGAFHRDAEERLPQPEPEPAHGAWLVTLWLEAGGMAISQLLVIHARECVRL